MDDDKPILIDATPVHGSHSRPTLNSWLFSNYPHEALGLDNIDVVAALIKKAIEDRVRV